MHLFLQVIAIWGALSIALTAFIIFQRSPHFRHQLFRWTIAGFTPPRERQLAHVLVSAARHHR
jgi:hypothetical protein